MSTKTEPLLSEQQIEHLSSLSFINRIDDQLKIIAKVQVLPFTEQTESSVLLVLEIFYHNDRIDDISFNLHNYNYDEILQIAKNIRSNEYILQSVDNILAGDIE